MKRFYQMTYADDADYAVFGVAYAPSEVDAMLFPPSGRRVSAWTHICLELRDGGFPDYLANDLGGRLCSARMREVIERNRAEADEIQWLDVDVVSQQGEARRYCVLHFPRDFPVIDVDHSVMAGDMPVKVVLSYRQAVGHAIFTLPGEWGRRTYVSVDMRKAMQGIALTGLRFTNVPAK